MSLWLFDILICGQRNIDFNFCGKRPHDVWWEETQRKCRQQKKERKTFKDYVDLFIHIEREHYTNIHRKKKKRFFFSTTFI
jgi:hypothetical protein